MKNHSQSNDPKESATGKISRRNIVKYTGAGAAIATHQVWTKPIVNSVILPAHAACTPCEGSIVDIAIGADPEFSTLVGLVIDAGLAETLSCGGPYTVFAPTNQAFENIPEILGQLSPSQVKEVLLYHVVEGLTSEVPDTTGDTPAVTGPIAACNGQIWQVSEVLLPG